MSVYIAAYSAGLMPDETLTVSEWADAHRLLSNKASAEPGPWHTSRTPYLREIMDSLSVYDPCQRVAFMKSAQIGGTEAGNNWLGYVIHHAPAPMLYVQPTVDIAQKVSKQRVAPMIEESPALSERIAPARSRDSDNTLLVKSFPGGLLMMAGANSAAGLRSMPIRYLFLDEIDAYPGDVEGEGDPISLAEKRTTTFSRRKVFLVSTPTVKDASKIEREYERSDKRRYFVPCPHCDHAQWLRWRGFDADGDDETRAKDYRLRWLDEAKTAAGYLCEGCGTLIEEYHKTWLLEEADRRNLSGDKAYGWVATATGDGITRGYHINSLYSPAGWKSWVEILREFEESTTDASKLKTFVNTTLGEPFEEAFSVRMDAEGLAKRAESYPLMTVPAGGLVLTAGCDVQPNRIEIATRAWGEGEESWLVNYTVVHGDPYRPEIWEQVLAAIDTPYPHASGAMMTAYAAAIDSGDGNSTHQVYAFCRANKRRHIFPIKGMSQPGRAALGKPTKQDINLRGQVIKRGVELWPVGSDTIKTLMFGRIKGNVPGPGCYHWPVGLPPEYWTGLTAERQAVKFVNGFPKRTWVKKDGARNEPVDTEVYAYAALQYLYNRHNRATFWKQMRARVDRLLEKTPEIEHTAGEPDPELPAKPSGKSLLSGWRRG